VIGSLDAQPADVIDRFVARRHRAAAGLTARDEQAARTIMASPPG